MSSVSSCGDNISNVNNVFLIISHLESGWRRLSKRGAAGAAGWPPDGGGLCSRVAFAFAQGKGIAFGDEFYMLPEAVKTVKPGFARWKCTPLGAAHHFPRRGEVYSLLSLELT